MKALMVCAVLTMAAVQADAQGAVRVWTASELAAKGKELAKRLDAQKAANEVFTTEGNRSFLVAHREGSGIAELHEKHADIMVISVGEVTMVYGGTVVDPKTTQPGEIRGPSIQGGTEVRLGPGDILHIPAKVPHMMKLAPGKE